MIRKTLYVLILCLLSVCCAALFFSCGASTVTPEVQGPSPSPASEPAAQTEQGSSEAAEDDTLSDLPSDPSGEALSDSQNSKEIAVSLIGQDVSLLYEALGEPISAEYSLSCNGPGDDGLLTYDGFIVFTYREDGVETVFDVM